MKNLFNYLEATIQSATHISPIWGGALSLIVFCLVFLISRSFASLFFSVLLTLVVGSFLSVASINLADSIVGKMASPKVSSPAGQYQVQQSKKAEKQREMDKIIQQLRESIDD